jgi:hypothetical protein
VKAFAKTLILLFLLIGCSENIDLAPIDELIKQKKYEEAIQQIKDIDILLIPDSLILKRIKHRKILAEKGIVSLKMDMLFSKKNTSKISTEIALLNTFIKSKDSLSARWYLFDFYHYKGRYSFQQSDTLAWLKNTIIAMGYPSSDREIKTSLLMDIAFYYARKSEFVQAREWLDKAMRQFDVSSNKNKKLGHVFVHYMNGKFHLADSIFNTINDLNEKSHWQKVHSFLNLYADSLTMKNRFRLW